MGKIHAVGAEDTLMPESFQPNQELTAKLEVQEWNQVFAALQEMPFRVSAPIITKLRAQLVASETKPADLNPNGDT